MSASSIFRNALQVSPQRIVAMDEGDLNSLMRDLLLAQAYLCRSPIGEIIINADDKANDDGCDGWTARPQLEDEWLGSSDTCWQFKAGVAGEPARLRGEVAKRIPAETLTAGGRLVVVTSGSTSGRKGEKDRLEKLCEEARAHGLPADKIIVIGSERLAMWCNRLPAVAARWAALPDGLWTFETWSSADAHQAPWQASDTVNSELTAQRVNLQFDSGPVLHLHIQGHPGVGKTRFALELCREAEWRGSVVYIPQASDVRLQELIDAVAQDDGVRLTVVADEVQPEQLLPLHESIARANGRVRLITIGSCRTPDARRIPAILVRPLDSEMARAVVKGWYSAMPPEYVDFVVRFASGYIRLARLAADAVVGGVTIDVRGLLDRDEVRVFMDRMLGTADRRPLHVLAVLTTVGWDEEAQPEGRAVAEHLGLDWNDVRAKVESFQQRLGIAPRGGRYRYISPAPLGNYLAVEAWVTYPDLLRRLPDVLPSDAAKDAYYERLKLIASNPQARQYAREELDFFFRLDDFVDPRAVRRWSALSSADPDRAARTILRALAEVGVEDRKVIANQARRELVWTLVRLAWRPTSFADATKALALLAEAENETWANNATAEFLARFQLFLGGTAVPYFERLAVLDELLDEDRPALTKLAVRALSRVGERHEMRVNIEPATDELPEKEWRPPTGREHLECIEAAVGRLVALASRAVPDNRDELVKAAEALSTLMHEVAVRPSVAGLFDAVRAAYPDSRELLRRAIADVIRREQLRLQNQSSNDVAELEVLHARFEDRSLDARLRQQVGHPHWRREEQPDLHPLARELVASQDILKQQWTWLTSGEATLAWQLGEALASADSEKILASTMPIFSGTGGDLRVLSGYVCGCRRQLGDSWYEQWLEAQRQRQPLPINLFFEIAWRCGATDSIGERIAEIIRSQTVDGAIVGQLEFGLWGTELSSEVLSQVLQAMIDAGHGSTALAILEHRIEFAPDERERWRLLALQMLTDTTLIKGRHMTGHYWSALAGRFVRAYPGEIAGAIMRAQVDHAAGSTWFAEHSEAAAVLNSCVEQDPLAVWSVMQPHLVSMKDAYMFSIGFPRGILDRIPVDQVMGWVTEEPDERAPMIAKLANKNLENDDTLWARALGTYGDEERTAGSFFSEFTSGTWWGEASAHWHDLSKVVEAVSKRTKLPKLRLWALKATQALRDMSDRDRQREEEEALRGH